LAGTGIVGLLLSYFTQTPPLFTFGLSAATGLVAGLAAAFAFRMLRTYQSDSLTRESDLVGKLGRVHVAIRGGELGRVRIENRGESIDLLAKSPDGETIEQGTDVIILEVSGTTVTVASRDRMFENTHETAH
jgi:membrane protein implicated in regulation of membrane protease activity